ncbi:hypothetical protein [Herbaspirillum robiniae]|uniref:2-dehydro-3-deoxyphosphooctonate aldolase n=1 Tax=Herbaspirillum robiniae TaxID=2014887 RepID=A0ABX2M160_9BURK|nr:hypothetical protein [Herbaspirillum robiniae]NUU01996.1 hypothetical protein [Herbaspirillum robiniae]
MRLDYRCAAPVFSVVFLAACQSPPQKPAYGPPVLPKILSSTVANGKGVPNGRSDNSDRYLHSALKSAEDPGYGYSQSNPVKVGPRTQGRLHIVYLNSLRGPKGEPLEYERKGACCMFANPATSAIPGGVGLLDVYRVRVEGEAQDRYLFVDMYDPGPPMIPVGMTQREP